MLEDGYLYRTLRKERLEDHGDYCDHREVLLGYNMFTKWGSFAL